VTKKQWYLAIVQFGSPSSEMLARAKQDFPIISDALKTLSNDCCRSLPASRDGQTMIWALRTSAHVNLITERIQNPVPVDPNGLSQVRIVPDTIRQGDKIMVFQLGDDRRLTDMNVIRHWLDTNWVSD
jgi:hypothetical protein